MVGYLVVGVVLAGVVLLVVVAWPVVRRARRLPLLARRVTAHRDEARRLLRRCRRLDDELAAVRVRAAGVRRRAGRTAEGPDSVYPCR